MKLFRAGTWRYSIFADIQGADISKHILANTNIYTFLFCFVFVVRNINSKNKIHLPFLECYKQHYNNLVTDSELCSVKEKNLPQFIGTYTSKLKLILLGTFLIG